MDFTYYPGSRHSYLVNFLRLNNWPEVTPIAQNLSQLYFRALVFITAWLCTLFGYPGSHMEKTCA